MTTPDAARRTAKEQEILAAAAKLFREQGYASTSMRDIASALGANHASNHYYFGTKAAVLFAICDKATQGVALEVSQLPPGLSPVDELSALVRIGVGEAARSPDYTAVFFQERLWLERHLGPEKSETIRARQKVFRDRVCAVVAKGTAQGVFADLDPVLVLELIVGSSAWVHQRPSDGEPDVAVLDQAVTAVLAGVVTARAQLAREGADR